MSQKLDDIMFVLEYIRDERDSRMNSGKPFSLRQLRIDGCKEWAELRKRDRTTIENAYIRGLKPAVSGTLAFDKLLKDYFDDGSEELLNILLKPEHASESSDHERINLFFDTALAAEAVLAAKFGLEPTDKYFMEGKERLELHRRKERNRSLVKYTKDKWNRDQAGRVCCSVCSFCFADRYGEVGENYIEAHHTVPLSSLAENTRMRPADLVPVCSNCHVVLHRAHPPLTVEQLRSTIGK